VKLRENSLALCAAAIAVTSSCNRSPPPPPPGLPVPVTPAASAAPAITDQQVLTRFHQLWYANSNTWHTNTWLGIPNQQNPMDVWIVQEILFKTKPDFIVECGAFHGGSAAMWAMILEQVNPDGRVISVDIEDRMGEARKLPIVKRKVDFIIGSSTAPEIVADVKRRVAGKKAMLLLDSDHSKKHVLAELNAFWEIVPVGGYINVQDTNVNGHPVVPAFGPGPMEAVREFLAKNDRFSIDSTQERLLFTFHPSGWLKRVK
jgi:cephalosporin hydroxylase